ncbi:hypothetical protein NM208_g4939 [Fusarium decemcellulare]|uniref:Uncharacterized protein n=1 Tax=Fusarium decemcellulare TaxID=57161 RepID=A0ACC1SJ24_9HYPO|nr:hypothetical protein NM208_g4939 [Fusarium decemcellulare]
MPSTAIPADFVWHEEVNDLFAPSKICVDVISNWLQSSLDVRLMFLFPNKQWIRFNASVAELQELLHTEYYEYEVPIPPTAG